MTRSAWTGEDCIRLRAHIESGGSVARASVIFKRSISTIQVQPRKLGTPFPDSRVVRRQWLTRYAEAERVTSLRDAGSRHVAAASRSGDRPVWSGACRCEGQGIKVCNPGS
jgi:hypothetical protein